MQTEGFHILVVYNVKTEVKQSLVTGVVAFKERTDIEFKFIKHAFVNKPSAVDEIFQKGILFYCLQMLIGYVFNCQ